MGVRIRGMNVTECMPHFSFKLLLLSVILFIYFFFIPAIIHLVSRSVYVFSPAAGGLPVATATGLYACSASLQTSEGELYCVMFFHLLCVPLP